MKIFFIFIVLAILISSFGCSARDNGYCERPAIFSEHSRELKSPGFWISLHPFADEILLDEQEILRLNRHIADKLGLVKNIPSLRESIKGETLSRILRSSLDSIANVANSSKISEKQSRDFLSDVEKNMRLNAIPDIIRIRYGLTNAYVDQRILPSESSLPASQDKYFFDDLQNSSLDLGTPVAVIHESADGRWIYIWGHTSDGWVKKEKVSILNRKKLREYANTSEFAVVTSAKADIYLDSKMTLYHDTVRMGARFPAKSSDRAVVEIKIPVRTDSGGSEIRKAYISKEAVNLGYLAYTPRNVIHQAFKMLNAPYSWGSANGEQDCSGFIQHVFASFGIALPRNSKAQAEIGVLIGKFGKHSEDREKLTALSEKAVVGATLIYMNGHIMLYLGSYEGKPYVIHDIWGYSHRGKSGEEQLIIGRVAVTDLNLGEGSSRGSLLKRILSIRNIGPNTDF